MGPGPSYGYRAMGTDRSGSGYKAMGPGPVRKENSGDVLSLATAVGIDDSM